MAIDYETIVTASLAKQIAEKIRSAILGGHLRTDERLPTEEDLAKRFGVSRPTIREALKRLAAQNLIRSRRGPTGGNFVSSPTSEELAETLNATTTLIVSMEEFEHEDIVRARLELESVCCKLACEHRQDSHLQAMEDELNVQRDDSFSDVDFCASDVRFHRTLVESTGNGVLRLMIFPALEALMPITNMVISRVRDRHMIVSYHQLILQALRDRKPEAAIAALSDLINYHRERYAEAQQRRERLTQGGRATNLSAATPPGSSAAV